MGIKDNSSAFFTPIFSVTGIFFGRVLGSSKKYEVLNDGYIGLSSVCVNFVIELDPKSEVFLSLQSVHAVTKMLNLL